MLKMFLLLIAMWLAYYLLVLVQAHFWSRYILFFQKKNKNKKEKEKKKK